MLRPALHRLGQILISVGSQPAQPPGDAASARRHKTFNRRAEGLVKSRDRSTPVFAGAVQFIGLKDLKTQLGAAWEDVAQEAYGIAQRVIAENLAETDVCERYDDETYIVCFADLDRPQAERKSRRIVKSIKAALLEAATEAKHLEVEHAIAEVPDEELGAAAGESLIDVLAGALRKVRSEVVEAQQNWLRVLLHDANVVFAPIWSPKKRSVLMCQCLLDDITGKAALRRIEALSGPEQLRGAMADLDCVILGHAVRAVHHLVQQREEKMVVVVPVNFQTLSEKVHRDAFLRLCKDMPSCYSQFLMMEVHGISPGVPTGRAMELCLYLRPYCRSIIIEASIADSAIMRTDATSIFAVSIRLDDPIDDDLATALEKFATAMKARSFHSIAHGADTIGLAEAAIRSGIDFISGKAVALPLESLRGAYHWTPSSLPRVVKAGERRGLALPRRDERADKARKTGVSEAMAEPTPPRLMQMLDDWHRWRAGRPLPTRADIKPNALKHLAENIALVDIERPPLRFRFERQGREAVAQFRTDLTGRHLDEMPHADMREALRSQFEAAIARRAPIAGFRDGAFADGAPWAFNFLVLPFSDADDTVDMLMVGLF